MIYLIPESAPITSKREYDFMSFITWNGPGKQLPRHATYWFRVPIKESTPTLASPYTFSSSMSINCNRIPRGGWPRIFLWSPHRPRGKGAKIYLHPLHGLSVNIKMFIFNKLIRERGCEVSPWKLWTLILCLRSTGHNLYNSVFWRQI